MTHKRTLTEIVIAAAEKRIEELEEKNARLKADNDALSEIIDERDGAIYRLQQRIAEPVEHGARHPTHCLDCGEVWEDHDGAVCWGIREEAMKGHPAHTPMEIPHIYWMDLARQGFDFADRLEEGKTWTLYQHVQLIRTLSAYVEKLGKRRDNWKAFAEAESARLGNARLSIRELTERLRKAEIRPTTLSTRRVAEENKTFLLRATDAEQRLHVCQTALEDAENRLKGYEDQNHETFVDCNKRLAGANKQVCEENARLQSQLRKAKDGHSEAVDHCFDLIDLLLLGQDLVRNYVIPANSRGEWSEARGKLLEWDKLLKEYGNRGGAYDTALERRKRVWAVIEELAAMRRIPHLYVLASKAQALVDERKKQ